MIVTLGVCAPRDAQAQTVNPVQTTTYDLGANNPVINPIIFGTINGTATNIDTTATAGADAVFGPSPTAWIVTVAPQAQLLGNANGIFITSNGSSVTNAGTISGSNLNGITIDAKNASVNNTGSISGIVGVSILDDSGVVANSGTITGTGGKSVNFSGSGTNTLTLQTGSVLNGDAVATVAAATNKLVLQGTGIANNNFFGFNSLDVQGVWLLNGRSSGGTTTLETGGELTVGGDASHAGALLVGNVTVNRQASLRGLGSITGDINVLSGGAVIPGLPTGTLTVEGNVTFASGSFFRVNVDAAGNSSKLFVVGANTATLTGATVNVSAQNGTYQPSTQYTILTAAGGLGGTTFTGVTTNLAFLTPTLSYTANDVTLTLVNNGGGGGGGGGTTGFGFATVAQTRNQAAVATALDGGPVTNPLIVAVLNQTADGARQAFDALSGEVFGSVHNVQAGETQFARSAMLGRLRQASYAGYIGELGALAFGGPELAYAGDNANAAYAADVGAAMPGKAPMHAPGTSRDLTFWAQGLGSWGHAESDGNAAALRSRSGGFLSGADARFGDIWRAGLVAGYVRTDLNVDDRASSAGIDSVQVGAYAGGKLGALNVRGGASYSFDSIDVSRGIFFPGFTDQTKASFHGNVGQVFGEVGYGIMLNHLAVEPIAGLAYVHVHDNGFLESGGAAALTGSSAHENIGYSTLGIRAASAVPLANGTVLVPRASVQWQYAFGDVTPVTALAFQGTGTGFTVAGIPIARNTALVEGGFDWRFSPRAKVGAFYQGELAAHAQVHAVKGGFTWDF